MYIRSAQRHLFSKTAIRFLQRDQCVFCNHLVEFSSQWAYSLVLCHFMYTWCMMWYTVAFPLSFWHFFVLDPKADGCAFVSIPLWLNFVIPHQFLCADNPIDRSHFDFSPFSSVFLSFTLLNFSTNSPTRFTWNVRKSLIPSCITLYYRPVFFNLLSWCERVFCDIEFTHLCDLIQVWWCSTVLPSMSCSFCKISFLPAVVLSFPICLCNQPFFFTSLVMHSSSLSLEVPLFNSFCSIRHLSHSLQCILFGTLQRGIRVTWLEWLRILKCSSFLLYSANYSETQEHHQHPLLQFWYNVHVSRLYPFVRIQHCSTFPFSFCLHQLLSLLTKLVYARSHVILFPPHLDLSKSNGIVSCSLHPTGCTKSVSS